MIVLDEYEALLAPHLPPGFSFREIVNGTRTHEMPPRKLWQNMVRPLQLANELRASMKCRGARGLLVNAAYRPKGGAILSKHKKNIAIDLDLIPGDYDYAAAFVDEAVTLLCTVGHNENLRIGLYGRPGSCASIRVHVDTATGARGWQHYAQKEYSLAKSDIPVVATRLGLILPPRRYS